TMARAERERVSTPGAAHHDGAAVAVEAQHPDLLGAEEPPDLLGDDGEEILRLLGSGHEGGDALKRGLLALAAASLGDVAPDAVHHALVGDGRHRPLDPFVRAVLADDPVLERSGRLASDHASRLLLGALAVIRVDELHERPRKRLALAVTENGLDGGGHTLPVAVEACDDHHR